MTIRSGFSASKLAIRVAARARRATHTLGAPDRMAISEFESKRYEKIVQTYLDGRRPPPHIRPELDLGCRVTGQSVELFEIRPVWRGRPGEKMEHPFAKATYVKSRAVWKVYWQRADLKWHRYEPNFEVRNLEEFLTVVENDEYGCFYG